MNFPSSFYSNNRQRLAAMHPDSLIIIASNTSMQRAGDVCYPFSQNSNFYYLTGLNIPNAVLLIDSRKDQTTLLIPKQSDIEITFQGKLDLDFLKSQSGINRVDDYGNLEQYLSKDFQKIYFNLSKNRPSIAINPHRFNVQQIIKKSIKKISDIRPSLDRLRMYKQPLEIEALKKASLITKETLQIVEKAIKTGLKSENELMIIVNTEFAKKDVTHAYQPIIAAGKNSLILHYITGSQPDDPRSKAILLDIGAEYARYGADISRTYSLFQDPKVDELINSVKKTQNEIISFLKPGITWKDFHRRSQEILIGELSKISEDVGPDNINQFFPHAVGHYLGLDTHDSGDYRRPLEKDMVITVEPGYYNPIKGFGIRFEDDVLITSDGAQVL